MEGYGMEGNEIAARETSSNSGGRGRKMMEWEGLEWKRENGMNGNGRD